MSRKKGVLLGVALAVGLLSAHSQATIQLVDNGKGPVWRKKVFSYIYDTKHWWDGESFSGPGSSLSSTSTIRLLLPVILKAIGARTLLDAGCGDFHWMEQLINEFDLDLYLGVDIVQEIIEENQKKYGNEHVIFMNLDIAEDPLFGADVIMCRDVLAHLSYEDINKVLRNFKKSGAKYLLASSYSLVKRNNVEMISGNCRSVNLHLAPFNFPEPLISVMELSSEEKMVQHGKRICLWRIADLPII